MTKHEKLVAILKYFGYYDLDDDFVCQIDDRRDTVSFRYFGNWETPDGVDDDEDYDWKVPTERTANRVDRICNDLKNLYNLDVQWSAEEKEWISVKVLSY